MKLKRALLSERNRVLIWSFSNSRSTSRLANSSKVIKSEWLRSKTRALLISNGCTHEMPDSITKIESFVGENLKRLASWFFSELRSRSISNLRGPFNHKNEWSLSDCCFG